MNQDASNGPVAAILTLDLTTERHLGYALTAGDRLGFLTAALIKLG
jgi:hypothetical protein